MPIQRIFHLVFDAGLIGFGVWTLLCNVLVFAGASFQALLALSPLVTVATWALMRWLRSSEAEERPDTREGSPPRFALLTRILITVAIVGAYLVTSSLLLLWGSTSVFFALMWLGRPRPHQEPAVPGRGEAAWVILALLLAVTVTLVAHRPDQDDGYYASVPVWLLDNPDRPMLATDTMHGYEEYPLLRPIYRATSYEILVGAAAFLTRQDPRWIYYVVFPAALAVLLVATSWLALRRVTSHAGLGCMAMLLVMVAWGDEHWTYGNFGLVRLYQGKGILVSLCVPALLYLANRFLTTGHRHDFLRLALAQVASMGVTVNGIFIAPFVVGLCAMAAWRPTRASTLRLVAAAGSCFLVILVALAVRGRNSEFGSVGHVFDVRNTAAMLEMVTGGGARHYLAMFGVLALGALCDTPRTRCLVGYLTVIWVFGLSPWSAELVGRVSSVFSIRYLWVLPLPWLLGAAAALAAERGRALGPMRAGAMVSLVAIAAFVLVPGRSTLSSANRTELRRPGFKMLAERKVAERVHELTPRGGLVLAPWKVSNTLTSIRDHPRIVGVRDQYLDLIVRPAEGELETERRRSMILYIMGGRPLGPIVRMMRQQIRILGIDTVVLDPRFLRPRLPEALREDGFDLAETVDGFAIYVRATRSAPSP